MSRCMDLASYRAKFFQFHKDLQPNMSACSRTRAPLQLGRPGAADIGCGAVAAAIVRRPVAAFRPDRLPFVRRTPQAALAWKHSFVLS